ncbi:MAG: DUF21 domain-containing protein [Proteobacteria bacterium]|nr:DUF21 domain-containing protein [Pseudomonadota bacterium]
MDDLSLLLHIAALVLLILCSGFFSGSETALMTLNKLKLKHQSKEGRKGAKIVESIIKRPDSLIGTILLGNNLVNVASSALATSLAISLWGSELGLLYATILMTLVLLIFAEVTPKTFAAYHSEGVSYMVARPLKLLMVLLKPFVLFVTFFSNGIIKFMGIKKIKSDVLTEDELKTMILLGEEAGFLGSKKKEMLHGILDLRDISVKDVMVPRTDIFAIDIESPMDEIKEKILSTPYSRIPVFRKNIEKIEGVLLVNDFLRAMATGAKINLEEIITPPYFIPESKDIQEQLTDFQKKRVHLAIILDEFGGIEGLVSMEDLLEEIVGEIWDESDSRERWIVKHRDGSMTVDGKLTIRDLGKELEVDLPEDEFNTVAGLLLHGLGTIPSGGDSLEYMGFQFTAVKVEGQAVKKVRVKKITEL